MRTGRTITQYSPLAEYVRAAQPCVIRVGFGYGPERRGNVISLPPPPLPPLRFASVAPPRQQSRPKRVGRRWCVCVSSAIAAAARSIYAVVVVGWRVGRAGGSSRQWRRGEGEHCARTVGGWRVSRFPRWVTSRAAPSPTIFTSSSVCGGGVCAVMTVIHVMLPRKSFVMCVYARRRRYYYYYYYYRHRYYYCCHYMKRTSADRSMQHLPVYNRGTVLRTSFKAVAKPPPSSSSSRPSFFFPPSF